MVAKLKLTAVPDDRPVKLTIEVPAAVHRDLVAYAEVLARQTSQKVEPAKLIAPMLARFRSVSLIGMAGDERPSRSVVFLKILGQLGPRYPFESTLCFGTFPPNVPLPIRDGRH
jgi:hypothetical protein